jgi:hypothetical protein
MMRFSGNIMMYERKSTYITMLALTILFTISVLSTQTTLVFAQNATGSSNQTVMDTFNSHGTISGIAADTLIGSNETMGSHSADLFVLGGNWSLGVERGNLSDFNADIIMTKFDGTQRHPHVFENIRNTTGNVSPVNSENISLVSNNFTGFAGVVDIGKWKDVSISGNLNNGNLLILNVDPVKTEHHFKGLPIYGTVTSLTDQSGKELRTQ